MTTRRHTILLGLYSRFFLNLYLLFFLCSCGSPYTNHYFPVNNHDQRASSLGFSIAPPSGVGWYEKINNNSLYYLKKMPSDDYSIYTKATEIHLDDSELEADKFLQYVKNNKKLNTASGNYRNVSFHFTHDTALSPHCIRYVQSYDDYGIKNLKKNEFVRVKNVGLVCMHPENPQNGIDMFYVESTMQSQGTHDQSYKDEGESFLHSLKFHLARD
ncbi:MAG: hypothetical protein V2B20_17340 [Pseudomonadota bacterium]